jgi:hypothetical protein
MRPLRYEFTLCLASRLILIKTNFEKAFLDTPESFVFERDRHFAYPQVSRDMSDREERKMPTIRLHPTGRAVQFSINTEEVEGQVEVESGLITCVFDVVWC